jgi:hypothetical protein
MRRSLFVVIVGVVLLIGLAGVAVPQTSDAAAAANAKVPRLVRFSGMLNDVGGKPLQGAVEVSFLLYKDEAGGEPLWFETQTVDADMQGRYTALLGAMHPDGLPVDLFTAGEARWLGTMVGKVEQPRVLLVSVPYALKAGDAETLGGKAASAYLLAPENQRGSATTTAATNSTSGSFTKGAMGLPTTLTAATGITPNALITGTQNYIPVFTDNSGSMGNSLMYQSGTNLGIGTANPAGRLHSYVSSNSLQTPILVENDHGGYGVAAIGFGGASSALGEAASFKAGIGLTRYGPNGQGDLVFYNRGVNDALSFTEADEKLRLTLGGNLGIGTANPAGRLHAHVSSNSLQTPILVENDHGGYGVAAMGFGGASSALGEASSFKAGIGLTRNGPNGQGDLVFYNRGVNDALSFTEADEKLRLTWGGNVGIGTTAPTAKLEVNGTAKFDGLVTFAPSQTFPGATVTGSETVQGSVTASGQLVSTVATGTAPLGVTSTTAVTNLNADMVDGLHAASFAVLGSNLYTAGQTIATGASGATALTAQATDVTSGNTGVHGIADGPDGSGVVGEANNGAVAIGVWGISSSGLAGQFDGDVNVSGNLSKSGGSFKIDHPMDPANKYLLHSFVESPDMMNIYNGNAALDANGEAVIELPQWFDALNKDFRYQLTAIGAPGPNLYVAEEVRGNHFKIAGGGAGTKVSWQVTGVRKDAWANTHRIPVEQEKSEKERGYYLHPELVGAPAEKGVSWAQHPGVMRRSRHAD